MKSRQQFVFVRRVILFLFCALTLLCAAPSDAHMYFSFPADSDATGRVDIYTAFALDPPAPDESGYGAIRYDISGRLVGPSGAETAVADFTYCNSKTGKAYTEEQLAAMGDGAASAVDSRRSTVSVSGSGTSVFLTKSTFVEEEPYGDITFLLDFDCTSKAFLNLTADGASTKAYFSGGLELVPMNDLASVTPVTNLRVKALLDGAPVPGLGIYVSYEGCPQNPELHSEVAAMRIGTTGSDGIAALLMPSNPGNVYLFAMNLGAESTQTNYAGQMASLSFVMPEGGDELDVSGVIFRSNGAGLGAPIYAVADINSFLLSTFGIVWANDLMTQPAGTSSFVEGMGGQLDGGETGAAFRLPMDITGASVKGAIGTEQEVELTAEILGQNTFDDMVAFLKNARANEAERFMQDEAGRSFYCPFAAGDFFGEFGISVMARFANSTVRDVSDSFMLGVVYDESLFAGGRICIVYGTLYIDSASDNGSYVTDLTPYFDPSGFSKVPLLHDGAADGTIEMTYWLASEESYSGGSSGCSAGVPISAPAFALAGLAIAAKKKR